MFVSGEGGEVVEKSWRTGWKYVHQNLEKKTEEI
jgi:hypothetical protein